VSRSLFLSGDSERAQRGLFLAVLDRSLGGDASDVGQFLCGAFEATGESLEYFDSDFRMFADHILHIPSVIFRDDGWGACFDGARSWLAKDVAHLTKNRAGIHQDV
jgi:hypothetical protein